MGDQPPPILSLNELFAAQSLYPDYVAPGIIRISETLVMKFGKRTRMSEAETMHLLSRKAPSVPVPKLRNAYAIAGVGYILMDYVNGSMLGDCWEDMNEDQKKSIVTQLKQHVSSWRLIEGSFFGTVDHGPCRERLFGHSYEYPGESHGPYLSRPDYNRGLVQALRNSRPPGVAPETSLESQIMMSSGNKIVLTHGDLHQDNVIVGCDGDIAAILDWGESCYSIEEMEYCCTRWGSHNEQWQAYIPYFLRAYPDRFDFWNHLNEEMRVYTGI
jgi:aminoglycoside phosphotransferase (APT) family kinase protein